MNIQLQKISHVFVDVAKREESCLSELCGEGIFLMPELAYAYNCGKEIMRQRDDLFPGVDVKWRRELKVGKSGICDLVIELKGLGMVAIEFKIRATSSQYIRDINKLQELCEGNSDEICTNNTAKIFCALVDAWSAGKDDDRIVAVEKTVGDILTPLSQPFPRFSTHQGRYIGGIDCIVATWLVGNKPVWVAK